jgi:hypothetical protein
MAQVNQLENRGSGATVSAYRIEVINPDNTYTIPHEVRAVWVGGAGNLAVETAGGDSVTIVGVTAGTLLPIQVRKILLTGTTATSIQVWW